jgi:hypothetical protein
MSQSVLPKFFVLLIKKKTCSFPRSKTTKALLVKAIDFESFKASTFERVHFGETLKR